MKAFGLISVIVATLVGCASAQQSGAKQRRLDFSTVEALGVDAGVISADAVRLLGRPSRVVSLKRDLSNKDAWIYEEGEGDFRFERLGLLVDRKTGAVESATWSVREGDALNSKSATLAHFEHARFVPKITGPVSADYSSDDQIYSDQAKGISFLVDGARQTVRSISFIISVRKKLADGA